MLFFRRIYEIWSSIIRYFGRGREYVPLVLDPMELAEVQKRRKRSRCCGEKSEADRLLV